MCRGVADEAIVAVKPSANEGMVTYPRIKLKESDREVGGEGRNMESKTRRHKYPSSAISPKGNRKSARTYTRALTQARRYPDEIDKQKGDKEEK